jgi:hypothetical protein
VARNLLDFKQSLCEWIETLERRHKCEKEVVRTPSIRWASAQAFSFGQTGIQIMNLNRSTDMRAGD